MHAFALPLKLSRPGCANVFILNDKSFPAVLTLTYKANLSQVNCSFRFVYFELLQPRT